VKDDSPTLKQKRQDHVDFIARCRGAVLRAERSEQKWVEFPLGEARRLVALAGRASLDGGGRPPKATTLKLRRLWGGGLIVREYRAEREKLIAGGMAPKTATEKVVAKLAKEKGWAEATARAALLRRGVKR